jgi:hypothetical protein
LLELMVVIAADIIVMALVIGNDGAGDRRLGWTGLFACPTTTNIVTMARGAPIKPDSYTRMSAAGTPSPARS